MDEDALMEAALEAGADDFANEGEAYEITCAPDDFSAVYDALEQAGYTFASAQIERIPDNYIRLDDETAGKNMQKLLDMLEDNDDVQNVYHNWEETEQE